MNRRPRNALKSNTDNDRRGAGRDGQRGVATTTGDRPDRQGKSIIGGHFTQDTKFAVQELLVRMGRAAGSRVTVQDAIGMGLERIFREYDVEPPDELARLRRPAHPKAAVGPRRKLARAAAE